MNCDEFREAFLGGSLDAEHQDHLSVCSSCRRELPHLTELRDALADSAIWEEPSPGTATNVVTAVVDEARSAQSLRRWWPRIAAAAASAVVLVTVGAVLGLQTNPPDWEIRLAGSDLAPAAAGTVKGWNTAPGSRLVLKASGLDPAPEGSVYEMWLSAGNRHVSAGTFTSADEVELTAGVARADFPRVWVTLEPLDDDPAPSWTTMLDSEA